MHPYLPHLLEDIRAAERPAAETGIPDPDSVERMFEEIDLWVQGGGGGSLSEYSGLRPEEFPPPGQLSDDDIELIYTAFEIFLSTWNAALSLPEPMPWPQKYTLMLKALGSHDFFLFSSGRYTFDFCTGSTSECELGTYCPCRDYEEENTETDF